MAKSCSGCGWWLSGVIDDKGKDDRRWGFCRRATEIHINGKPTSLKGQYRESDAGLETHADAHCKGWTEFVQDDE